MKRIKEISIQNFKAFQQEQKFLVAGKNVLVYGNNGAGKSSFFWALYTLLQSSTKNDESVQKYFKKYVTSDRSTHQNLKNVFMDENEHSFIKLTAIDTDTQREETYTISHDVINTNDSDNTLIQELNLASDFINYKLLHNFYRASHQQEVNLWAVFERDIFPFLTEGTQNWLEDIIKRITLDVPRTPKDYVVSSGRRSSYELRLTNLNDKIEALLVEISNNANDFIKEHFFEGKDAIKISLTFVKKFRFDLVKQRIWNESKSSQRHDELHIKLNVKVYDETAENNWRKIERVQSFLNEAQLTKIAIGVRIGALRTRPLAEAKFKILVLDDMLISLDLSNRMDIVRVILNKEGKESLNFFDGFQKFILTHDKGFFNLIRRNTDDREWTYFDFNKDESLNGSPIVRPNFTPFQTAVKNFENDEFENAGNNLRLEAEAIFTSYLDPNMKSINTEYITLKKKIDTSYNIISLENYKKFKRKFIKKWDNEKLKKIITDFETDVTLNSGEKLRLKAIQKELFEFFIYMNEQNFQKEKVVEDIGEILDRILNPASHHSDNPLHRAELRYAIEKIKELKGHLANA